MSEKTTKYDILVAGSGYSGSLTALLLHQSGFKVCLLEKKSHPRFAIGESSTPIADMILRTFADRYDLPWLNTFSRYGSWQQHYPEVPCGIKRGFSYFNIPKHHSFATDHFHSNELLVAASTDNQNSDTNWLRSGFDHHLVKKVQSYGIAYFDHTEVTEATKTDDGWDCQINSSHNLDAVHCRFFIDATGAGMAARQLFSASVDSSHFKTNSSAAYGHFSGVIPWMDKLKSQKIPVVDYPYNPDNSANHLVLDAGWLWLLRFNNGTTSAGLVLDRNQNQKSSAEELWEQMLADYPDIREIFQHAKLIKPSDGLRKTGRLQRQIDRSYGYRWAALPNSVGFVDPLHSTGIAHSLAGIEKLVELLNEHSLNSNELEKGLANYQKSVYRELSFIDLLVAGCYRSLPNFKLFTLWSMLYFTATVWYEQARLKGNIPSHFLCADHPEISHFTTDLFDELNHLLNENKQGHTISPEKMNRFRHSIKEAISPYNEAGLLQQNANNMYHHTAVELS